MRKPPKLLNIAIASVLLLGGTWVGVAYAQSTSSPTSAVRSLILKYANIRTNLKASFAKTAAAKAATDKVAADKLAAQKAADKLAAQKAADKLAAQKAADKLAAKKAAAENTNTYSRAS